MSARPAQYTITASAGAGGSISPAGATTVNYGGSQAYTITPAVGYHIADVLVDGASVGAVASYTFENVTAGHTIEARFAINTYTITASAGAGGSISPAGDTTVNYGGSQAYTITPAVGYHVLDVLVDGVSVGAVASYTFENVTAGHTIQASFAVNTYTITATAGAGGSISPAGATTVNYGGSQAYTITPAVGYHVLDVLVDGASVGAVGSYTFTTVDGNHTISATFVLERYAEDFDDQPPAVTPEGWMNTASDNCLGEDDRLLKVVEVDGERVLGTTTSGRNYHSHCVIPGSEALTAYEFRGRMMSTDAGSGIGVTFFSQYPARDAYSRLCRYKGGTYHLDARGTTVPGGITDTGVIPSPLVWQRFRIQVLDLGDRTALRAKVWEDGAVEPEAWQAEAWDDTATRLTSGTIGVWSFTIGANYWDDFCVEPLADGMSVPAPGDADGDGMLDRWEVWHLGSVAPDGGGDRDGDGLVDGEESGRGSNPKLADSDGDGLTDPEELVAGTHPGYRSDCLRLECLADAAPSPMRLMWKTVSGRTYTVYARETLRTSWRPVGTVRGNGEAVIFDAPGETGAQGFYIMGVRRENEP